MKKTLIILGTLVTISAYSQVGINTEIPKATLDVVGNPTNATAVDGVIIPRITGNELKAKDALYGADQTGTIIYATAAASPTTVKTAEITAAGFYYFNGSIWKATGGGSGIDTNIYNSNGAVTAGANRTVTIPDATNVNFNGVDGGSFYAWTDSGDIGLFGYQDFGKISLNTAGDNADIKIHTIGTDSNVLLQSNSADKNVGIGTILPTAKLHTNGTVRLEGLAASTTNTNYLTTDANGNVTRTAIPTGQWQLLGNTGTTVGTNFIGTTDDVDFVLKRNNLQAGLLSDSTTQNTGLGTAGLPLSSTGTQNSGFGALSLGKNTAGNGNSTFGTYALAENTTGNGNSAFGSNVLKLNLGSENSVFGYNSLASMTSGSGNSIFGNRSGEELTTGSYNTLCGNFAIDGHSSASYNSVFGTQSVIFGFGATLNENCILGATAGDRLTTGTRNIGIGGDALQDNTIGNDNVAIGCFSVREGSITSNNVAIGFSSLRVVINNNNTALGLRSGDSINSGAINTAIGVDAGSDITTGSNNIAIGNNAQVPIATASNQLRMGDTNITSARVQVAWSVTSDKRWKDDIKDLHLGLNFIKQLRPVSYIRKNDEVKKLEYGFIAQEVQEILAKNGAADSGMITKADDSMLSVRYNDLIVTIVKAIQEQQVQIESIEKKTAALEAKRLKVKN